MVDTYKASPTLQVEVSIPDMRPANTISPFVLFVIASLAIPIAGIVPLPSASANSTSGTD